VDLLLLGDVDEREAAAPDPRRLRVEDAERERRRARGVDGVASRLENRGAGR
jgi:hypothetical protein